MQEYEVLIETINPCGGEAHANKEFREIETDSPEAYVREHSRRGCVFYPNITWARTAGLPSAFLTAMRQRPSSRRQKTPSVSPSRQGLA